MQCRYTELEDLLYNKLVKLVLQIEYNIVLIEKGLYILYVLYIIIIFIVLYNMLN